jgi:hypothetical protein
VRSARRNASSDCNPIEGDFFQHPIIVNASRDGCVTTITGFLGRFLGWIS